LNEASYHKAKEIAKRMEDALEDFDTNEFAKTIINGVRNQLLKKESTLHLETVIYILDTWEITFPETNFFDEEKQDDNITKDEEKIDSEDRRALITVDGTTPEQVEPMSWSSSSSFFMPSGSGSFSGVSSIVPPGLAQSILSSIMPPGSVLSSLSSESSMPPAMPAAWSRSSMPPTMPTPSSDPFTSPPFFSGSPMSSMMSMSFPQPQPQPTGATVVHSQIRAGGVNNGMSKPNTSVFLRSKFVIQSLRLKTNDPPGITVTNFMTRFGISLPCEGHNVIDTITNIVLGRHWALLESLLFTCSESFYSYSLLQLHNDVDLLLVSAGAPIDVYNKWRSIAIEPRMKSGCFVKCGNYHTCGCRQY